MSTSPRRVVPAIPAILLTLVGLTVNAADENPQARTISVIGHGKVSAAPDVAEISVGLATQSTTAQVALSTNNESMTALLNVLKERGVAAKDIQTSQITIQPLYSQQSANTPGRAPVEYSPKVVGYQVQNMVRITSRDLAKLGPLLDAVVGAGANRMHGITFRVDSSDALTDLARKKAMADAKRKAELLAGEAGMVLGAPITIRDDPGSSPIAPPIGPYLMAAPAASTPVAPGEQELSVSVQVVYELKTPR
jgi:uncharacterized protein